MSPTPPHLTVSGLAKTFTLHVLGGKRVVALRGVSFSVERGAFVGVVGPSGGGKSTLLKCLCRTYLASRGTIEYRAADGRALDLATADDEEIVALRRGRSATSRSSCAPPRASPRWTWWPGR